MTRADDLPLLTTFCGCTCHAFPGVKHMTACCAQIGTMRWTVEDEDEEIASFSELEAAQKRLNARISELSAELAVKDQVLTEIAALVPELRAAAAAWAPTGGLYIDQGHSDGLRDAANRLAARILGAFPDDETADSADRCSTCGQSFDAIGCVVGLDGKPAHTIGGGCAANPSAKAVQA